MQYAGRQRHPSTTRILFPIVVTVMAGLIVAPFAWLWSAS